MKVGFYKETLVHYQRRKMFNFSGSSLEILELLVVMIPNKERNPYFYSKVCIKFPSLLRVSFL